MLRILILLSIYVVCFVNVIETARRGPYQQNRRTSPSSYPVDCSTGSYKKNPRSCTSFYQCDNGRAVLQQCGAGTEFSERLSVCTHPKDANCEVDSSGSDNNSYGSSKPASQQTQNQQYRPGSSNQGQSNYYGGGNQRPSGSNQQQNNNSGGNQRPSGNNQGRQDGGTGSTSSNGNSNGKFYYDMIFTDF